MKLIKTASGKRTIKMSKSEWKSIGKTAGWMKTANDYAMEVGRARKLFDDGNVDEALKVMQGFDSSFTMEELESLASQNKNVVSSVNKTIKTAGMKAYLASLFAAGVMGAAALAPQPAMANPVNTQTQNNTPVAEQVVLNNSKAQSDVMKSMQKCVNNNDYRTLKNVVDNVLGGGYFQDAEINIKTIKSIQTFLAKGKEAMQEKMQPQQAQRYRDYAMNLAQKVVSEYSNKAIQRGQDISNVLDKGGLQEAVQDLGRATAKPLQ